MSTLERPLHDGLSSPSEDRLNLVLRLLLARRVIRGNAGRLSLSGRSGHEPASETGSVGRE